MSSFWKNSTFSLINNPDASIGVCCSHKVIALGFNTLCYDAERRGIKPSARIKIPRRKTARYRFLSTNKFSV